MTGILISFEGGECTGKDSQIFLLKKRLLSINPNYKILSEGIREPGSTLKAEVIRMLVKNIADSDFVFPGDFKQTFNFEKYKEDFEKDVLPLPAKKYLSEVIKLRGGGVKHDVVSFILNDEHSNDAKLKDLIIALNNSPDVSPAKVILGEYFRDEVLSPKEQFYLYAASGNLVYDKIIIPALEKFDFVILNRSRDSSTIYQGHAQDPSLKEWIRKINKEATYGHHPNITILIDLSVEEICARKSGRDVVRSDMTKDFFDEKEESFHQQVREGYLLEAEFYESLPEGHPEKGRIKVVNGIGTPEEVHERIWKVIEPCLK
ncbi:MAG: dTMP kinase [Candidatus Nanoarchaeia archaeon]